MKFSMELFVVCYTSSSLSLCVGCCIAYILHFNYDRRCSLLCLQVIFHFPPSHTPSHIRILVPFVGMLWYQLLIWRWKNKQDLTGGHLCVIREEKHRQIHHIQM